MPHCARGALSVLLAAAMAACPADADRLVEIGRVVWSGAAPGFGGFSGLEVSDDGRRIVTVSDRGALVRATLKRRQGRLSGVERALLYPMVQTDGTPLPPSMSDAEGLAGAVDGTLYVSFEGHHRVARLAPGDAVPRYVQRADAFGTFQTNSGLEALATDPEGRLITFPERSGALDRPFPVFRLDARGWSQPYALRRAPPYLPVGADMGPDDRLYVLERHFTGLGFAIQIRSFAFGATGLTDERILLRSAAGSHDNLEGIAAWRDKSGTIRLLAISDDNFHFLQRTEIVEFHLATETRGEPSH